MRAETPFAAVLPEGVSLVTMHFFRASSMILPKPSFYFFALSRQLPPTTRAQGKLEAERHHRQLLPVSTPCDLKKRAGDRPHENRKGNCTRRATVLI